jgi:hypothetical protein
MQVPVEIAFRNIPADPRLERLIRQKVAHLDRLHPGLISCHVALGPAQGRHATGNLQQVVLDARLPGAHLVVRRTQTDRPGRAYLAAVLRDGFNAMERQLAARHQQRQNRGQIPAGALQGRIAELQPARDFGQIVGNDQRLVYFHRNSLLGCRLEDLEIADPVSFSVQPGEGVAGPQASSVRPIGALRLDPRRP